MLHQKLLCHIITTSIKALLLATDELGSNPLIAYLYYSKLCKNEEKRDCE